VDREHFCQCPCCGNWLSIDEILDGPRVEPVGMTFDGGDPHFNLLYFNHLDPQCGSTFTIEAERFAPYLPETAPAQILAGGPDCENHCTSMDNLLECQAPCHWAPYRRFLLALRMRRRRRAA
jgi:hypothetical protein